MQDNDGMGRRQWYRGQKSAEKSAIIFRLGGKVAMTVFGLEEDQILINQVGVIGAVCDGCVSAFPYVKKCNCPY